ncbi:MAG: NAD(P)H-dependent oxidoreductase [Methanothrix soehngenii]|jgi:putative NADPH-quinone reductase|uniref:NAD(P)H-dependent oxidoreductase n=2 Tax=Methanothrix soehngenii TaxID=2223 RepID=UPI003142C792
MNVSLILAHPNQGSFNHAIAIAAINALEGNGHSVSFHDLYRERFDPVLPYGEIPKGADIDSNLMKHCQEIASADGIIIVHPNWWGMPPAILKGWVDRVIRPGVAYEFLEGDSGEGVPRGLLKARKALVFNTSNTFPDREREAFGDPLQRLWKDCIFGLCGVEEFYRKTYCVIATSTPVKRTAWLEDAEDTVAEIFPKDRNR